MTKPKLCDWCGEPVKDHVREGRYVVCVGEKARLDSMNVVVSTDFGHRDPKTWKATDAMLSNPLSGQSKGDVDGA